MTIREEAKAGLDTAIIRAFAATGGVVTTAGIVFGPTMFALIPATVPSIAQLGTTIGVGLLLDTLIVRSHPRPASADGPTRPVVPVAITTRLPISGDEGLTVCRKTYRFSRSVADSHGRWPTDAGSGPIVRITRVPKPSRTYDGGGVAPDRCCHILSSGVMCSSQVATPGRLGVSRARHAGARPACRWRIRVNPPAASLYTLREGGMR